MPGGIHKIVQQVKKKQQPETTVTSADKATVEKLISAPVDKSPAQRRAPIGASELKEAPEAPFPVSVSPMLATLVDKPVDEEGWLYEVKWDGYRTLALCNKSEVSLKSRNNKPFDEKFYPVFEAVRNWNIFAVVDGEIAVLNDQGLSNFGALQNWRSEADGELIYYVFDLLWLDGKDLTKLPLIKRKEILQSLVPVGGIIRLSENFDATATEFFSLAAQMGLEGIIAKKADSVYLPGARSSGWLKIKTGKRQEVVIGGFTNNENSSKPFSSLLVGVYEKDALVYTGKIGTGFTQKLQQELLEKFKPLQIKTCPFRNEPDINKPSRFRPNPPKAVATWLKPELVCEVSFAEMTSDGVMRHPSFAGLRIDKNPADIIQEIEKPAEAFTGNEQTLTKKKIIMPTGKAERKTLLNPKEQTQVKSIGGHDLKFTNLSKIYWPDEKITKRDMLNYYYQIAPFILPYLKDRPQSLNRFPNGINGMSFYQKDVTGKVPDWIEKFLYHSDDSDRDKHFMVCTDEASLLYMASLGCIELNPWSSRVSKPDNPDWCIIDLDPSEKTTFNQVIEAAQVTKKILDDLKAPSYPKTSGSTGIHIYIPLGAKYSYEQSKEFGRMVVKKVQAELPVFTSIERQVSKRNGKMYLDFLQNRPQATIAAPYSLRPKPGATVSMPLHWEEVKKGLKMKHFTIRNSVDRVKAEGDIFKPVIGKGFNIAKFLKDLA